MKVYAVFVRHDTMSDRFIDSQWAVEARAQERMQDLTTVFKAMESSHTACIYTLRVEDVAIGGAPE